MLRSTLLLFICLAFSACAGDTEKLNVVFVMIDDMGFTDLGCCGSTFYQTPNLDKLAADGMRFTYAYSACTVCSPSRAALLTGKSPARLHLTDWIAGHERPYAKLKIPEWRKYLPLEETTLAELFKQHGYATACIGKWHLGGAEYAPDKQGFDINRGGGDRGQPPSYFSPYKMKELADGPPGEYLTDRECDEALQFIAQNKDNPFFIYLPHYAVHQPVQAKPEVVAKFKTAADKDNAHHNPIYAAMLTALDEAMGRIVQKLAELKLDQRTIIVFTSDNGGLLPVTGNLPARAGKGSAYEGGVRIPLLVKWPGATKPGTVCNTPVIHMDWFPSFLTMLEPGRAAPENLDGMNLQPLLTQQGLFPNRPLFWHYPHYHPGGAAPYSAIRDGEFRLVEFFEDNHVELFNLKDDESEKTDLAEKLPEKAEALKKKLHAWRESVGAQLPVPNPAFDPARQNEEAHAKK